MHSPYYNTFLTRLYASPIHSVSFSRQCITRLSRTTTEITNKRLCNQTHQDVRVSIVLSLFVCIEVYLGLGTELGSIGTGPVVQNLITYGQTAVVNVPGIEIILF